MCMKNMGLLVICNIKFCIIDWLLMSKAVIFYIFTSYLQFFSGVHCQPCHVFNAQTHSPDELVVGILQPATCKKKTDKQSKQTNKLSQTDNKINKQK